jgi:RNA polymerase sigma factor for flagellar operon FliA
LVRQVAQRVLRGLPGTFDLNDLIQTGMLGLLEAAPRYEDGMGASFATFAGYRIRGAILDSLRKSDWLPRAARRRGHVIEVATLHHRAAAGELSRSAAIAASIGVTLQEYHRTLIYIDRSRLISLDEVGRSCAALVPADPASGPAEAVERLDVLRAARAAISRLPEYERTLLTLYYDEDYSLREIGDLYELSESRICQIHKRLLKHLRTAMRC